MGFPGKNVHMTGIGGVGMSGVARMLLSEGVAVSGSDLAESPVLDALRALGASVAVGQAEGNVPAEAEVLVASAAITEENPELIEARRRGLEVLKYAEALGLLMGRKLGVAVSGTHGKTTTTAMLAWILTGAGLDPSFVVGAEVRGLETSSRGGTGEVFLAEACEYDRSFLCLSPTIAIINNIEEDHLDYYSGIDEIVEVFREFAALLPADGLLLANADDRHAMSLLAGAGSRKASFGIDTEADYRATALEADHGRYSFDLVRRGERLGRARLGIPGAHNVLNALGAFAVVDELGVDFKTFAEWLPGFAGAARRFSLVGSGRGVSVIDDYAHHPTEVQATLKAARDSMDSGKLWVVFQPHQYSRTRFFLKSFARSFALADHVIVPDIYFVRDSEQEKKLVNALDLVREMSALGCEAEYIPEWGAIVERILSEVADGDMVITMGAGNIHEVAYELARRLQSDPD